MRVTNLYESVKTGLLIKLYLCVLVFYALQCKINVVQIYGTDLCLTHKISINKSHT